METQEALKIMRALANGVNPQTGEALEVDSVCRHAEIVKALNRALCALVQLEQRERSRPVNAGRTWTRAEDAQVCEQVKSGTDHTASAQGSIGGRRQASGSGPRASRSGKPHDASYVKSTFV
jgi:hypothetical protein